MEGFRSIAALVVSAFLVPWASQRGLNLSAADQVKCIAGIAVAMRFFTKTPVFSSLRDWLNSRFKPAEITVSSFTPAAAEFIACAVAAKFAVRQKQAPPFSSTETRP